MGLVKSREPLVDRGNIVDDRRLIYLEFGCNLGTTASRGSPCSM